MADAQELKAELDRLREEVGTLSRVRVVSVKGKGLRKYDGTEGAITFEEWKGEAKSCLNKQDLTGVEGVNFLLGHLEGTARDEIRYTRDADRNTPDKVFDILEDAFGIRQSATQLMDAFFAYRQGEKESIREYSHALMKLLGKVQKKDNARISDADVVLRDQFAEKVRDPHLRRELKKRVRQDSALTFKQIREEAYDWEEDDQVPRKKATVHEVEGVMQEPEVVVEAARAKPAEPEWQQKMFAMMECQQQAFSKLADAMSTFSIQQRSAEAREVSAVSQGSFHREPRVRRCFKCRGTDHLVKDCPEKRREANFGQSQTFQQRAPPAQNPKGQQSFQSKQPLNGAAPQ